jgi:drug/metabolite transporter (DMT)-like permease
MLEAYPYQNQLLNEPTYLLEVTILQCIVSVILLVAGILVFLKYRQNHKPEVRNLFLTFLFMGFSFVSATVPQIMAFVAPYNDWINGIPVLYASWHFWWTNISYLLITISVLFLLAFTSILFEGTKIRIAFWIFVGLVVIFNIWNIYQGIYIHSTDSTQDSLPTVPWGVVFLVIGVIPWVILAVLSANLHKRIEPSVFRTGVRFIEVSAICTILSYVMFVLHSEIVDVNTKNALEFCYWLFFIFTAFLLYVGYILPAWFKKRVEK